MQLPSSTPVSDPALVALPLPGSLPGVNGETPSAIPSESSPGFDSLIAQLTPSASPRQLVPAGGRAASQPSLRTGLGAKQSEPFAPEPASMTSTPRGLGAMASFFRSGEPQAVIAADESAISELTMLEEKLPGDETPLNLFSPVLPLPQPEALPPVLLAASEQKPAVTDQASEDSLHATGNSEFVASSAPGSSDASARGRRGAYLKSGDNLAIHARAAGYGKSTATLTGPENSMPSADLSTPDKAPGFAAAGTTDSTEATGQARAALAVATAQSGPAGVVAQGVPFLGSSKITSGELKDNGMKFRAVRAAAAKFAAAEADVKLQEQPAQTSGNKTFLDTGIKEFADNVKWLGTAIAKLEMSMLPRFSSSSQLHPGSEYTGDRMLAAEAAAEVHPEISSTESVVSSAGEAVEAILQATDRITSREQRSVDLNFSVGDAQLAVRVELHGEEVRTSFRTDSPELQAALADEWSARVAEGGDTILRFAAPSITGSNTSSAGEFSDRAPQQQQQNREPRPGDVHSEFMRHERSRGEPVLAPTIPAVAPGATLTSHRLLSFA